VVIGRLCELVLRTKQANEVSCSCFGAGFWCGSEVEVSVSEIQEVQV